MGIEEISAGMVNPELSQIVTSSFSTQILGGVAGGMLAYSLTKKYVERNSGTRGRRERANSRNMLYDFKTYAPLFAAMGGVYAGTKIVSYLESLMGMAFYH